MKKWAKKWLAVPEPPWHLAVSALEAVDDMICGYVQKIDRRRTGPLTLCEYEAGKCRRKTDNTGKD